jgi:hypothetical protein
MVSKAKWNKWGWAEQCDNVSPANISGKKEKINEFATNTKKNQIMDLYTEMN